MENDLFRHALLKRVMTDTPATKDFPAALRERTQHLWSSNSTAKFLDLIKEVGTTLMLEKGMGLAVPDVLQALQYLSDDVEAFLRLSPVEQEKRLAALKITK